MSTTAYIYVSQKSSGNFDIGLSRGVWGWRSSGLDRADARAAVQSLKEGDLIVFGYGGPANRVPPGEWADVGLRRVVVTQVTSPYYVDRTPVWPDDEYPERIGIDVLDEEEDVHGSAVGADGMEALRLSSNKQGVAILRAGTAVVANLAGALPPVAPGSGDGSIDHDGAENAVAQVLVRREQAKLRRRLLNGAAQATCALCGRTLPVRFIRAAHIKRRSAATREERLQLANVMPACLLGCDELFEHGYVYVTGDGSIAVSDKTNTTPHLTEAAKALEGLTVADYGPSRAPFFTWHCDNVAR
ncbi:hypothetical protein V2J94_25930 [Streptomyces sp. DSM 41524]|uniref:HNH nuclease domain-containing protein n=1 Tax=Streptomyces asiaticus subsp. ignotus TaxID=3098222 RepID=A0ABU7Q3N4_9ACTN|nr:hypothetical protein [Streptomyces sp. DSM 41524]